MISTRLDIGFGTNGITDKQTMSIAIQEGYRLFDSADLYNNKEILAEAIHESGISRNEFFINYKISPSLSKEEFLKSVDDAIKQFGYLDCIMLHDLIVDDPSDILKSLEDYRNTGKVKSIGVSNVSAPMLETLILDYPEIKYVQNQFSHVNQDEQVLHLCKKHGIKYTGYGLFGGRELGACMYNFNVNTTPWNLSELLFPEFNELTKKYKITPHQMLLVWANLQETIQIPSSTKRDNMVANLSAINIASSMPEEDKHKLFASLDLQLPHDQWKNIEELAEHGDRLSRLKQIVGNDITKHKLLEKLYHDDALKALYDKLLDLSVPPVIVGKPTMQQKLERFDADEFREKLCGLTYFIEEFLKISEAELLQNIEKIKTLWNLCEAQEEYDQLYNFINVFGAQRPYSYRKECLNSYYLERIYLKEKGYFEIVEINLSKKNNDILISRYNNDSYNDEEKRELLSKRFKTNLILAGNDKKIYLLKQASQFLTFDELVNIVAERFPNDIEKKPLYMNNKNEINGHEIVFNYGLAPNADFIYIGKQEIDYDFANFYHNINEQTSFFKKPAELASDYTHRFFGDKKNENTGSNEKAADIHFSKK